MLWYHMKIKECHNLAQCHWNQMINMKSTRYLHRTHSPDKRTVIVCHFYCQMLDDKRFIISIILFWTLTRLKNDMTFVTEEIAQWLDSAMFTMWPIRIKRCCHSNWSKHGFMSFKSQSHGHYGDVIMGTIASQITIYTIVYSTIYSDADERKHQSSASLAFVRGIRRDRWIPHTNGQ